MAKKFRPTDRTTDNPANWFSYWDSNAEVLARIGGAFNPSAQDTPDMTVLVGAGSIFTGGALVEQDAQSTGTITAPTSNPRIDLVYIDATTGAVGVTTGSEAGSPSAPACPSGKLPVAHVALATSTTSITDSLLTDKRGVWLWQTAEDVSYGASDVKTALDGLVIGSGAGELVACASNAKLPAYDGSSLTGLTLSQVTDAGTAAGYDVGTGPSQIPTNEMLGSGDIRFNRVTITSDQTWTAPANLVGKPWGYVDGGGSSGSSTSTVGYGARGGASGGAAWGEMDIEPGDNVQIIIGAGGVAPPAGTSGFGPGGTTSFGSYLSATGGNGVTPGEGSGGDENRTGQKGEQSVTNGTTSIYGGRGGDCPGLWGGPGGPAPDPAASGATPIPGNDAVGYGGGGSGCSDMSSSLGGQGGNGKPGHAVVEFLTDGEAA